MKKTTLFLIIIQLLTIFKSVYANGFYDSESTSDPLHSSYRSYMGYTHSTDSVVDEIDTLRNRRLQEERTRINKLYFQNKLSSQEVERLLMEGSKPYLPKNCKETLARQIYDTAGSIKLYSSIRHVTSGKHITDIFNTALYGSATLDRMKKPYDPAVLSVTDEMLGGDADVICFGANRIDPGCFKHTKVAVLHMDLEKIKRNLS
jgi:hypothetical protein